MNARILLIGQGLFLDGLTRILAEQPNTEVVASTSTWAEARTQISQHKPHIVIVDHDAPHLRESNLADLLKSEINAIKVIYLTLSANKMIVHNHQQLTDVSLPDLIQALQSPGNEGADIP